MGHWIFLIPGVPVAIFLALVFLPRTLRNKFMYVSPIGMIASAILSLVVVIQQFPGTHMLESFYHTSYRLGVLAGRPLDIAISIDGLGALMLAMVAIIGSCVQVYSLSYMKEDERRGWYFTVMSLFTAAMLLLVMSGDLLLIFAMWEIMGVCSYLLIGFWYKEHSPRYASQKAFLVTRAGDGGFFIALAAIWFACGTFNIQQIVGSAASWASPLAIVVALGLMWAAMGKSAQFPLCVWLPDAMAGPTPGSALIHAATMVAAGVYMVARMLPVFQLTPWIMTLMGWIGIITALIGASIACFQTDLKKMMAYSTISQLGIMFVALGAGSAVAALFHLYTHAFFKSLLFLAAGVIIHGTHTQDMRKMGGLARQMPATTAIFSIGAFALAGLIPLSGFFSKDEIFAVVLHGHNYIGFGLALLMGTLTSLYVVKAWFTVFFGKPHNTHVHEGGPLELIPIGVLGFITLVGGFGAVTFATYIGEHGAWPSLMMASISTGVTLFGGALGYLFYRGVFTKPWLQKWSAPLFVVYENKLYLDWFYNRVIIVPFFWTADKLWAFDAKVLDGIVNGASKAYTKITAIGWAFDSTIVDGLVNGFAAIYVEMCNAGRWIDAHIIDGVVNGLANASRGFGDSLKGLQTGKVQTYQRIVIAGVVMLLLVIVVLKGS